MSRTTLIRSVVAVSAMALLSACGGSSDSASDSVASPGSSCDAADLATFKDGTLTVATGEPAFPPWVIDDKPESGEGFESAVAYAVADQLGFDKGDVVWVRTTFDGAVAPGPKEFDFNIQQFTISDERKQAVDFSSGYYDVAQAIVSYEGSPIAEATTIDDLKDAKLGAAVGTTSLIAIEEQIQPTSKASVFNDNAAGVAALKNKQIDGLVVDLPTAYYLANVEVDNGIIVGQLANPGSDAEQFGLLMAKGSRSPPA